MCRARARRDFVQIWRDCISQNKRLVGDRIAKNQEWSFYIDGLCKSGIITLKQYENWL